ncbi:arsenic resistance N-acetyltransferase ArsN2 [Ancylobacter sp. A5.8]|uniref:arsenic resistance N-acetyltransferase ArsN2 n=1 Tax=Ancylobacter gelatini TaxID=2919920 RepID=UPI001F4EA55A|nr:arsenic resistance N-acetyltransferase ArsN2 [Ancylobacter gelatini]MCJ8144023.1 arsenic resistance N-acetyltransferase ArsN2 [Ancylobacter gelatini]
MDVSIYHNPACGTSRNTLALLRHAGADPRVIEYLTTPPSRAELDDLARRIGLPLHDLIRQKGTPYAELGLGAPGIDEERLHAAIAAHPILINRPIVVAPGGVKLCRPSDVVLDLLPVAPPDGLLKEEGVPFLKDTRLAGNDAGLRAALEAEGLPVDDLGEPWAALFRYDTLEGESVGYGGFELHGPDALVRSVVVSPGARGAGIGRNIVPLLLFRAYEAGARRAFLLTTSAAPFFGKLGFRDMARDAAPNAIRASRQFAALCPASASLMTRKLGF